MGRLLTMGDQSGGGEEPWKPLMDEYVFFETSYCIVDGNASIEVMGDRILEGCKQLVGIST